MPELAALRPSEPQFRPLGVATVEPDRLNFKILNETNSTFAGKPGHTIVWSGIIPVNYNMTTATNKSVKEMQTFVVNNNMGYVITYKTIASDFDKYLAQAQRIMNSFVLT
jgi:hypothetical protein